MIENLLKYQEADAKVRNIEKELSKSEERKKAIEAKKYLDGVEALVNKLDDRSAELLLAYEELKKLSAKFEEQKAELSDVVANVEDESGANFLTKKVEELALSIRGVASKIKKLEEELSNIAKEYAMIRNKTKEEQEKYKENAKKFNEFKASFEAPKKEAEEELNKLKKSVDPVLMEKYLKKRENKIYPVIYEVEEHGKDNIVCGCCKMELSLSEVSLLKSGEVLEHSCGRLIFRRK